MDLTEEEKTFIVKFRHARKFAEGNRQATLEICFLPGGRVFLLKAGFQEKIEVGKPKNSE